MTTVRAAHEKRAHRVLIAGGGVAALEVLLGLRHLAGDRVAVTVIAPHGRFLYRPVTVGEAFRRSEARAYELAPIVQERDCDRLVTGSLIRVDPDSRVVHLSTGEEYSYDSLVVACGAVPRAAVTGALTFRGREDVPLLQGLLEDLIAVRAHSVAYALPSERDWPLPLYELALMTAAHLRDHGAGQARVWVVSPEEQPLALFGPSAADALRPLLAAHGIMMRMSSRPRRFVERRLELAGGATLFVDRVVALPTLDGPRVDGLPSDERGFIPVDSHGQVSGCRDVFAAGDVTSFPLKQGGLATQQADAVAEAVAAEAGASVRPQPFRPVLRGLLMTGGAPMYLRAEPHRLPRQVSVAIDASRSRRAAGALSVTADQPLWWPPAKIAGRYLSPQLATARPLPLAAALLADRVPVPGAPLPEGEYEDALGLALLLADCDARWGDYTMALEALHAAETLQGSLPPEYESKRRLWEAARTDLRST